MKKSKSQVALKEPKVGGSIYFHVNPKTGQCDRVELASKIRQPGETRYKTESRYLWVDFNSEVAIGNAVRTLFFDFQARQKMEERSPTK